MTGRWQLGRLVFGENSDGRCKRILELAGLDGPHKSEQKRKRDAETGEDEDDENGHNLSFPLLPCELSTASCRTRTERQK